VAGGPLDDCQGGREPGVLEVRGRPMTRPVCTCGVPAETCSSAERFRGVRTSGTGPTQRAADTRTLALDDVGCRLPTVRSVLVSVEVGALCSPERGTAGREDSLHTFPA
jgi:hypothetical protein